MSVNTATRNLTDRELVARTLLDRHAYAGLVEKYQAALSRYISRLGARDIASIQDILQESFIKAYISLNDYDPTLPFSSWIYRIVHNETISYFRKQKNRPRPIENEADLEIFEKIADDFDVVRDTDVRRRGQAVRIAIDTLDPSYKAVLILRFFEEKSYDEISDILHIPSGTVATYLNRGKIQLKEYIKKSKILEV